MNNQRSFLLLLVLILLLSLMISGCRQQSETGPSATASVLPVANTPNPTATKTPQPTATLKSTATSTPTRTPTPTKDITATTAAQETASADLVKSIIDPELEAYGVDPSDGHIAWLQTRQIQMDLISYMEDKNHFLDELGSVSDFVIQSRVTWHTSGALSLCGITFRADEDRELGSQNRFFLMRLQFDPSWTIWRWEYGQFQSYLTGDPGWLSSRHIHDENGSTNLLGLVVRGKNIEVYINREKQLVLEDTNREEGWLSLSANQESGDTMCRFENSWVWVFDE